MLSLFPDSHADSPSETRDTYRRRYEMNSFNVQLITGIRANIMLPRWTSFYSAGG